MTARQRARYASRIANARWAKKTAEERKAWGAFLAESRRKAREARAAEARAAGE